MEHILEEFYELVQIPSPSLGEREMADALKQKLGELGFFVTEDDAGKKRAEMQATCLRGCRLPMVRRRPPYCFRHTWTESPAVMRSSRSWTETLW